MMVKGSGGLLFIHTTLEDRPSKEQQRQVRSHVSRGRPRKGTPNKKSTRWMPTASDTDVAFTQMVAAPRTVGTDLSLARLPVPLKPMMVHHALRFLAEINHSLYPKEICLRVENTESPWAGYLTTDPAYLNAILFAEESYGNILLRRDQSNIAQHYLVKTLQLLRERISCPSSPLAVSDPTIMAVVVLALASEALGDSPTLTNHLEGLMRMINLRGGFDRVGSGESHLAAKICRVDLSAAVRFDRRPTFFSEPSWSRYFDDNGSTPESYRGAATGTDAFVQSLDWRLSNVWQDLRHFSYISHLAYSSGYKLRHDMYSDIMVSVLYRLLHLTIEDCSASSAIHLGLAAFTSSMFLRWKTQEPGNNSSVRKFGDALWELRESHAVSTVPDPVLLWLLLLWHVLLWVPRGEHDDQISLQSQLWLSAVIDRLGLSTWDEARKMVKTMVWIGFLHDAKAEAAFGEALSHGSAGEVR